MSAEAENTVKRTVKNAVNNGKAAAAETERSFADAVEAAERSLTDAAKRAEKTIKETIREGVEALRSGPYAPYADRARDYAETAAHELDDVQRYVVERVKEKPVTATLAGLGVGLLLGLLLAGRGNK